MEKNYWRKCGSCKKEIGFNTLYQVCSVSTCSKTVFCSVDCWDMHNPVMNHKSSWSEEARSPKDDLTTQSGGVRRIITTPVAGTTPKALETSSHEEEVLVVVSKVKQYIKDKYDMNTSGSVMDILSKKIRHEVDLAAHKARRDGRKTLMDRDL